jgi:hypothetical protein
LGTKLEMNEPDFTPLARKNIDTGDIGLFILPVEKTLNVFDGAPIFIASSQEEKEEMALNLSKILGGMIHDLGNGVLFIVKH